MACVTIGGLTGVVVAFWTVERKHYHFKVFKPLEAVEEHDVPPAWYREALAVTPGTGVLYTVTAGLSADEFRGRGGSSSRHPHPDAVRKTQETRCPPA